MQPTLPGVEEAVTPNQGSFDVLPPEDRAPSAAHRRRASTETSTLPPPGAVLEVVLCYVCGDIMQRAGSLPRLSELWRHQRLLVVRARNTFRARSHVLS